ncbi:MAG TPA: ABC transporter ATP-binding protein [Candidatus Paceibacterota bacterium]|nr:ABC transporter ATP-binding protein [Candidatus Paceibacterota bacterium]
MIHLTGVYKQYGSGTSAFFALKDASLTVGAGEFVSILGPSGSGKSTLMHLMGALDRPSLGNVVIDGQNLVRLDDRALARFRNRKIGFVFQQFNLLPHLTALENVILPLTYSDITVNRTAYGMQMLEYFGIGHRADHRPSQLSGGEQQRVALARALICDPDIIMADEPTGNLDSKTGAYVFDMFTLLHRLGKTLIIVTHDEHLAERAERIVRIRDGEIIS